MVPWLVIDIEDKMNLFACYRYYKYCIFPGDQHNKALSIMFSYVHRPSTRREKQRIHDQSIHDLLNIMPFLGGKSGNPIKSYKE